MHPKPLIVSLTVIALAVTGCGSSSSSSSSTATSTRLDPPAPSSIYRVKLTGAAERPPGAANGSGDAVIAMHGARELCWRFAHLHGFTSATQAHIHVGAAAKSGSLFAALSTGPRLHHRGCVATGANVVKAIEKHPSGYYVSIESLRYPRGAVRAQL